MRGDPYLSSTKNQWTEYTLFTRACLQEWETMSDYQHISTQVRPVLQATQVRSPIQEDSTCHGTTTIIELSRAHKPQLQKPMHLVPVLCNEKNCHDERSNALQLEKSPHSSEDPAWPLPCKKKKNRERVTFLVYNTLCLNKTTDYSPWLLPSLVHIRLLPVVFEQLLFSLFPCALKVLIVFFFN